MAMAVQETSTNQTATAIQPQTVNTHERPPNTPHLIGDTWTLFLDVGKT